MFERGAYHRKVDTLGVVHKDYKMRVAHGYERAHILLAVDSNDRLRKQRAVSGGTLRGHGKLGNTHIHGDTVDRISGGVDVKRQMLHSTQGMKIDFCSVRQMLVIDELSHTSGTVATHPSLRAVGIEDAHGKIS